MAEIGSIVSARPTFEDRLKRYNGWLHKVAAHHSGTHPYGGEDDIFQDLCLVLFKCHEKYVTETGGCLSFPGGEFHNLFATAVANQIASHFRLKMLEHDKKMFRIDAAKARGTVGNGGREQGSEPDVVALASAVRTEESEDFYRAGIFDLIGELDPETAKVVMEALEPQNRGPKAGRAAAYHKVRNKLNDL